MALTRQEEFARLTSQNSTDLNNIIAPGGFQILTGTGAHATLTGYAVVVNEDTVFTVFNVDGVVQLSNYGLSGTTVKAGSYLPAPKGTQITDITMSSGTCILYHIA